MDALVAPLAALLAGRSHEVRTVLQLLRLEEDSGEAAERRRGVPGEVLLPDDRLNVELKPLRVFAPDEVVAYVDGASAKEAAKGAAASAQEAVEGAAKRVVPQVPKLPKVELPKLG